MTVSTRHVTVLDIETHTEVAAVETVRTRVHLRVVPPLRTETLDEPGARLTLTADEARALASALILHAEAAERNATGVVS